MLPIPTLHVGQIEVRLKLKPGVSEKLPEVVVKPKLPTVHAVHAKKTKITCYEVSTRCYLIYLGHCNSDPENIVYFILIRVSYNFVISLVMALKYYFIAIII